MVKIHRCIYCGELPHDSPRQNKNCERRHRSKTQSEVSTKSIQFRFGGKVQSRNRGRLYRKW